jgi:hypothetical protein
MTDQTDTRVPIVAQYLALAINRNVGLDRVHLRDEDINAQIVSARELLVEIDMHSPDATVRRLQRELHEAWGNDAVDWDLARAMQIVTDIDICRGVLDALKRAFKDQELDGGWRTALTHPLYAQTEAHIASLEDELRGLI